jgi:hypothetical protein
MRRNIQKVVTVFLEENELDLRSNTGVLMDPGAVLFYFRGRGAGFVPFEVERDICPSLINSALTSGSLHFPCALNLGIVNSLTFHPDCISRQRLYVIARL